MRIKLFTSRVSKILKNREAINKGLESLGKKKTTITRSGIIFDNPIIKDKSVLQAGRKAEKLILNKVGKDSNIHDRINQRKRFILGNGKVVDYSSLVGKRPDTVLRDAHGLSTLKDNIDILGQEGKYLQDLGIRKKGIIHRWIK